MFIIKLPCALTQCVLEVFDKNISLRRKIYSLDSIIKQTVFVVSTIQKCSCLNCQTYCSLCLTGAESESATVPRLLFCEHITDVYKNSYILHRSTYLISMLPFLLNGWVIPTRKYPWCSTDCSYQYCHGVDLVMAEEGRVEGRRPHLTDPYSEAASVVIPLCRCYSTTCIDVSMLKY